MYLTSKSKPRWREIIDDRCANGTEKRLPTTKTRAIFNWSGQLFAAEMQEAEETDMFLRLQLLNY